MASPTVFFARQLTEVGKRGVAGVQGEQFALDEGHQFVGGNHAGDGGDGAFELGAIDNPFAKDFNGHGKRVGVATTHRRNDAIDSAIHEAGIGINERSVVARSGQHFFL